MTTRRQCLAGALACAIALAHGSQIAAADLSSETLSVPHIGAALPETQQSHAFSGARFQVRPLDLGRSGYVEEEYLLSGTARVFDWTEAGLRVLGKGPYTTRILVRRPTNPRRASGTVIVEPLNPSESVDLPIMWAESYPRFMAAGDTWVGVTIKPNTILALKTFDPKRYASVAMPNPRGEPGCLAAAINPFSQPTTPADESGLAWDMLSEVGALLKSPSPRNPLGRPAQRLYMTGQSQTAGYARLYASVFARLELGPSGMPLYDGFLYSGSPPWQVPINQCWHDLPTGDPRLLTAPAGVPVIELFTQGDMQTNVGTRRPDSDAAPDLFRRYEIAGAAHVDPWEALSFASKSDRSRLPQRAQPDPREVCSPKDVENTDFPVRFVFDAAWDRLEAWVHEYTPAPHAEPLQLRSSRSPLPPDQAFLTDRFGNAQGGVRTPYVDVPTARWVGAKSGPFLCLFQGYKLPFDHAQLLRLYPSHEGYVAAVRASAARLALEGWLTATDQLEIVAEAGRAKVP